MITLEQVRLLDQRVTEAVELIEKLRSENRMLSDKLGSYQKKISELEVLLSGLKEDQSEVEIGFQRALEALSTIETAESGDTDQNLSGPDVSEDEARQQEISEGEETPRHDTLAEEMEEDKALEDLGVEASESDEEQESEDAELDIF